MATRTLTITHARPPLAPEHSRQIAERIDRAFREFADTLCRASGCSLGEARAVTQLYLKNKLAKLDAGIGRISVKHGAFLDAQAIRNAIEMTR